MNDYIKGVLLFGGVVVCIVGAALAFGKFLDSRSVLEEQTPAVLTVQTPTPARCIFVVDPPNDAGVGPVFLIPPKDFAPPPAGFVPMWLCAGPDLPLRYYSEPQGEVANPSALREEFN